MILITSAKYLSADFTLEFGKIPPSFLPLGNKRLYEYQVELFKDIKQKIILSLPKSFKLNHYDRKKLNELGVELLFVPENLSLGESIVYCLNIGCNFNEYLYILHGDTFFKNLSFKDDSLQVIKVRESYEWAYLDDDFLTINKTKGKDFILTGAYSITDPKFLIKSIVENNYSFIGGLKAYSKTYPFNVIKNDTWLDFGLITSYFHSKQVVSTQRIFNSISFKNGYIEKTSKWEKKIQAEINWFEKLPKEMILYVPKVLNGSNSYQIEYIYNNTLSELLVFGNLPHYVWKRIFYSLKEFLDHLHSFSIKNENISCINFDYKKKTLQRLNEFQKQSDIDLQKNIKINSKIYPSVYHLIEKLDLHLQKSKNNCFIHGDFCFSNIMYDFRSGRIKVFDPRGFDFNENITPYGDKNYDFAKLIHSIFGFYDFIIAGFFECDITEDQIEFFIDKNENLSGIQKEFLQIFNIDENIKALCIYLFLSMLPLHNDSKIKQIALLANAYRLYDEFFKEEG
ncbi:phosphotransferase [Campylobacter molothri]|uniref:phosphotransferase n=1 Tax=Campylobacter molothri TaxID=1032242 RepID=UPI0035B147C7